MPSAGYLDYMASPEWAAMRDVVKRRDRYRCHDCSAKHQLQVHHLTYARLRHESYSDLVTLCDRCHAARHATSWVKVPGGRPDGGIFAFDYRGARTEAPELRQEYVAALVRAGYATPPAPRRKRRWRRLFRRSTWTAGRSARFGS